MNGRKLKKPIASQIGLGKLELVVGRFLGFYDAAIVRDIVIADAKVPGPRIMGYTLLCWKQGLRFLSVKLR